MCGGASVVDLKLSAVHGLLSMLGSLLVFLAFLASKPSWMASSLMTRILVCRYCRAIDAGDLYFTGNRDGSCIGFSRVRNVHFRFLYGQSLG